MSAAKIVPAPAGELVRFTVYAILDPETRQPRYVGVTRRRLVDRMRSHWWGQRRSGAAPLYEWLRTLSECPPIRALATCSVRTAADTAPPPFALLLESSWIRHFHALRPLLNVYPLERTPYFGPHESEEEAMRRINTAWVEDETWICRQLAEGRSFEEIGSSYGRSARYMHRRFAEKVASLVRGEGWWAETCAEVGASDPDTMREYMAALNAAVDRRARAA